VVIVLQEKCMFLSTWNVIHYSANSYDKCTETALEDLYYHY